VRRLAPALLVLLLATACGSSPRTPASFVPRGPSDGIRVALPGYRWPLDPASVSGRDELTLARALFATPLTTDSRSGELRPGLCTRWTSTDGGRIWRFRCTHARAVAAGFRSRKEPFDAFWGQRYAQVIDLDDNIVDLFAPLPTPTA